MIQPLRERRPYNGLVVSRPPPRQERDRTPMAKKWIYWFEDLSSDFNELVGKKCANLGEMTQLGMRVSAGVRCQRGWVRTIHVGKRSRGRDQALCR